MILKSKSNQIVAQAVLKLRRSNHLTQTKLADLSGISQPNIANIEAGKTNATINTLASLASAVGKKVVIKFEDK